MCRTSCYVNIDTLELVRPRRVGVEQLALHAVAQLNLQEKLRELGFNRHQIAASLGNVIARLAFPASERASYHWLQARSGLGELMGYDFEGMGSDRLYYCLRTNLSDWDEKTLWKTYTMLTDLEAVFRSLKSELGLRPVYHHKEVRVKGHIFITLIAYHLVHTLRSQLKAQGIHDSWQTLRQKMENQQRVTVQLRREDGKTLHVRKATRAEPWQKAIYDALGLSAQPGPTQKVSV